MGSANSIMDEQRRIKRRRMLKWGGAALLVMAVGTAAALWHHRNEVVASSIEKLSLSTIDPLPQLQVGDVLLRMGVGADSYVISAASNSLYSHAGIVSAVSPEVLVTHATTADDEGSRFEGVITIPIANFISESTRIAILRYPGLDEDEKQQVTAWLKSKEGEPFRISEEEGAIYCSNLVLFALHDHVTMDISAQPINMPLMDGNFYFPQAFAADSNARTIYLYPKPEPAPAAAAAPAATAANKAEPHSDAQQSN